MRSVGRELSGNFLSGEVTRLLRDKYFLDAGEQ